MNSFSIHHPVTSRAGKRFEPIQERELYPSALQAARTLPGANAGVLVVPEMTGPLGVPDFIAIVGGQREMQRRIESGIPPILSELDCALMSVLFPARPRLVDSIAKELGWSEAAVRTRLSRLRRQDAVVETINGRFLRNEALTGGGTIYALEAKVRDWNQAIKQARGYRTWSNNYVLVLGPLGESAEKAASDAVIADGGGLYIGGRWKTKPAIRHPEKRRRILGFEHLIAAIHNVQPSDAMNSSSPASGALIQWSVPNEDPDIF